MNPFFLTPQTGPTPPLPLRVRLLALRISPPLIRLKQEDPDDARPRVRPAPRRPRIVLLGLVFAASAAGAFVAGTAARNLVPPLVEPPSGRVR